MTRPAVNSFDAFTAGPSVSSVEPILVRLDQVAPERVSHLWPGRAAFGKLSLTVGDPGSGKTYLWFDAFARVTRGLEWPDGGRAPSGPVIVLTAEDGLADTVRPRIDQQGGDASRVFVLRGVRVEGAEQHFTFEHNLPALEESIATTGARAVLVDPVSAFLGSKDSYKDSEIRGILSPLAALAERYAVAMVGILHLTKSAQRKLLLRAQGSVAFVAAARIVLAVGEDPDAPGRRLLVAVKNNLGPLAPGLAFHIGAEGMSWEAAPVTGTADQLLAIDEPATRTERREREEAIAFLKRLLANGPVPSAQVQTDAKANGIATRTLWRAKDELSIRAEQLTQHSKRAWFWSLPEEARGPW